jgi:hypothetical protein
MDPEVFGLGGTGGISAPDTVRVDHVRPPTPTPSMPPSPSPEVDGGDGKNALSGPEEVGVTGHLCAASKLFILVERKNTPISFVGRDFRLPRGSLPYSSGPSPGEEITLSESGERPGTLSRESMADWGWVK